MNECLLIPHQNLIKGYRSVFKFTEQNVINSNGNIETLINNSIKPLPTLAINNISKANVKYSTDGFSASYGNFNWNASSFSKDNVLFLSNTYKTANRCTVCFSSSRNANLGYCIFGYYNDNNRHDLLIISWNNSVQKKLRYFTCNTLNSWTYLTSTVSKYTISFQPTKNLPETGQFFIFQPSSITNSGTTNTVGDIILHSVDIEVFE